jgi:hypothetical protein
LNFKFARWKILKKIRKVAGPACQWPMAVCPSKRARRHHDGSVTTRHLAPALSTTHRLRSTRSPSRCRLHVRATPSSHVAATPRPIPRLFLGSRRAMLRTIPHLSRPTLLCLSLCSSVSSAEHRRMEPLLPPRGPPCHHRLGVCSPNRPLLRAD